MTWVHIIGLGFLLAAIAIGGAVVVRSYRDAWRQFLDMRGEQDR